MAACERRVQCTDGDQGREGDAPKGSRRGTIPVSNRLTFDPGGRSNLRKPPGRYNFCFMITETKSRKIGNSLGAIIPKEVAARLNIEEGTTLYFTEAPDGVRLTAHNPNFARKMAAAESLSRRYRNALRELAK
jgi:putative addiction module antidote